MTSSIR